MGNSFYNINNEKYHKLIITYGMPKTIAKIQVNYSDGSTESIVTGNDWEAAPSPIVFNHIYRGEAYDATHEVDGWDNPGFDDSHWKSAQIAKKPKGRLVAESTYPVKTVEVFSPENIKRRGLDTFMFDFRQNASGIVEISVRGKRSDTIRIYPSELVHEYFSENLKFAGSPYYFEYILKGDRVETWHPRFTYYGFRYANVYGAQPTNFKTAINTRNCWILKCCTRRTPRPYRIFLVFEPSFQPNRHINTVFHSKQPAKRNDRLAASRKTGLVRTDLPARGSHPV